MTAPGWYPDPDSHAGERYWNGAEWTQETRTVFQELPQSIPERPALVIPRAATPVVLPIEPMTSVPSPRKRRLPKAVLIMALAVGLIGGGIAVGIAVGGKSSDKEASAEAATVSADASRESPKLRIAGYVIFPGEAFCDVNGEYGSIIRSDAIMTIRDHADGSQIAVFVLSKAGFYTWPDVDLNEPLSLRFAFHAARFDELVSDVPDELDAIDVELADFPDLAPATALATSPGDLTNIRLALGGAPVEPSQPWEEHDRIPAARCLDP
jgi:hypothetical protein